MRLRYFFTITLSITLMVSPALADATDPDEASAVLYAELATLGPQLIELAKSSHDDPASLSDRIGKEIEVPAGVATQRWMDAAFNSGASADPFRPFASCLEAGTALQDLAVRFRRYLNGRDNAPLEQHDVLPFVGHIDDCALAIGVPVSGLAE